MGFNLSLYYFVILSVAHHSLPARRRRATVMYSDIISFQLKEIYQSYK